MLIKLNIILYSFNLNQLVSNKRLDFLFMHKIFMLSNELYDVNLSVRIKFHIRLRKNYQLCKNYRYK